jgi:hypothetical protein
MVRMGLFRDITTDEYGTAYDLVALLATAGYAGGLVLFIISCFYPIKFNLLEYAGGYSAMIASTAAAMRLKPAAQPPS